MNGRWGGFLGGERQFGNSGCASGGAGGPERSISPALIKVVLGNGLGVGGIELGGLVEVFGERFLGGLVCFPTAEPHGPHDELGLGRAPGGVEEGGEVGSPIWARICVMGSGSVRSAIEVRGSWQVGQIRGNTSYTLARRAAHLDGREGAVSDVRGSAPSAWGAGAVGFKNRHFKGPTRSCGHEGNVEGTDGRGQE